VTVSGPSPRIIGQLAGMFADAHAEPYSLVHGHLRWAAQEALEAVDIPDEADLADTDRMRVEGWARGAGRLP
jgi:hypothetical protein